MFRIDHHCTGSTSMTVRTEVYSSNSSDEEPQAAHPITIPTKDNNNKEGVVTTTKSTCSTESPVVTIAVTTTSNSNSRREEKLCDNDDDDGGGDAIIIDSASSSPQHAATTTTPNSRSGAGAGASNNDDRSDGGPDHHHRLTQVVVSPDSSSGASAVTAGSGDGGGPASSGNDSATSDGPDITTNTGMMNAGHGHGDPLTLAFYGIRDSRDEEEGDSSSLGYSDDSASLSDVYFHPQPGDDLARPGALLTRHPYYQYHHHHHSRSSGDSFDPLYPLPPPPPPPPPTNGQQQQAHHPPHHPMHGHNYNNNAQYSHQQQHMMQAAQFPLASYYGSMGAAAAATAHHASGGDAAAAAAAAHYHHHHHAHTRLHHSPLWNASGATTIQEDSPLLNDATTGVDAAAGTNNKAAASAVLTNKPGFEAALTSTTNSKKSSTTTSSKTATKKEQRRRRKHQQRHHHAMMTLRQREQAARERAVHQVKGQLQLSETWHDVAWAVLFVIQLVVVVAFAIRFGLYFYRFHDYDDEQNDNGSGGVVSWRLGDHVRHNAGKFHWEVRSISPGNNVHSETTTKNDDDDDAVASSPWELPFDFYNESDTSVGGNDNSNSTTTTSDDDTTTSTTYNSAAAADTYEDDDFSDFTIDFKNVVALTFCVGFYGWIISYLSFGFMLIVARSLIQIMLVFSIVLALAWGVVGLLLDPYGIISIMGFAALLLTLGYTMYSWNRIPFAATNLYTALCALRCTADITILGLVSLVVAFGWCLTWTVAFIGVVNSNNSADCDRNLDDCDVHVNRSRIPIYLLLLLSFHWTNMVIKNIVRVTVASAIGTWWFQQSSQVGRPFCTALVLRPLLRACTKSLGSICVGALVIQPAQFLQALSRLCCCSIASPYFYHVSNNNSKRFSSASIVVNQNGSSSSPSTMAEGATSNTHNTDETSGLVQDRSSRIDSPAESVGLHYRLWRTCRPLQNTLRSCNHWAFTYIGMYNYGFLSAGEKAIQLFETRQWMEVVEDSLIQNVLLMASVVIGGSAGVFAVVVEETDGFDFTSFHQPMFTAFLIGSVLGYVLSNILLLGVVGSAVNTVLVCFAAGPFEFDKNHPRLSREMREVWSQQVWEPAPSAVPSSSSAMSTAVAAATATTSIVK